MSTRHAAGRAMSTPGGGLPHHPRGSVQSPPASDAPLTPAECKLVDSGMISHNRLHEDPCFLQVHLGQPKYFPCGPALSGVVAVEQLRYLSPPSKASLRFSWVENLTRADRKAAGLSLTRTRQAIFDRAYDKYTSHGAHDFPAWADGGSDSIGADSGVTPGGKGGGGGEAPLSSMYALPEYHSGAAAVFDSHAAPAPMALADAGNHLAALTAYGHSPDLRCSRLHAMLLQDCSSMECSLMIGVGGGKVLHLMYCAPKGLQLHKTVDDAAAWLMRQVVPAAPHAGGVGVHPSSSSSSSSSSSVHNETAPFTVWHASVGAVNKHALLRQPSMGGSPGSTSTQQQQQQSLHSRSPLLTAHALEESSRSSSRSNTPGRGPPAFASQHSQGSTAGLQAANASSSADSSHHDKSHINLLEEKVLSLESTVQTLRSQLAASRGVGEEKVVSLESTIRTLQSQLAASGGGGGGGGSGDRGEGALSESYNRQGEQGAPLEVGMLSGGGGGGGGVMPLPAGDQEEDSAHNVLQLSANSVSQTGARLDFTRTTSYLDSVRRLNASTLADLQGRLSSNDDAALVLDRARALAADGAAQSQRLLDAHAAGLGLATAMRAEVHAAANQVDAATTLCSASAASVTAANQKLRALLSRPAPLSRHQSDVLTFQRGGSEASDDAFSTSFPALAKRREEGKSAAKAAVAQRVEAVEMAVLAKSATAAAAAPAAQAPLAPPAAAAATPSPASATIQQPVITEAVVVDDDVAPPVVIHIGAARRSVRDQYRQQALSSREGTDRVGAKKPPPQIPLTASEADRGEVTQPSQFREPENSNSGQESKEEKERVKGTTEQEESQVGAESTAAAAAVRHPDEHKSDDSFAKSFPALAKRREEGKSAAKAAVAQRVEAAEAAAAAGELAKSDQSSCMQADDAALPTAALSPSSSLAGVQRTDGLEVDGQHVVVDTPRSGSTSPLQVSAPSGGNCSSPESGSAKRREEGKPAAKSTVAQRVEASEAAAAATAVAKSVTAAAAATPAATPSRGVTREQPVVTEAVVVNQAAEVSVGKEGPVVNEAAEVRQDDEDDDDMVSVGHNKMTVSLLAAVQSERERRVKLQSSLTDTTQTMIDVGKVLHELLVQSKDMRRAVKGLTAVNNGSGGLNSSAISPQGWRSPENVKQRASDLATLETGNDFLVEGLREVVRTILPLAAGNAAAVGSPRMRSPTGSEGSMGSNERIGRVQALSPPATDLGQANRALTAA